MYKASSRVKAPTTARAAYSPRLELQSAIDSGKNLSVKRLPVSYGIVWLDVPRYE